MESIAANAWRREAAMAYSVLVLLTVTGSRFNSQNRCAAVRHRRTSANNSWQPLGGSKTGLQIIKGRGVLSRSPSDTRTSDTLSRSGSRQSEMLCMKH